MKSAIGGFLKKVTDKLFDHWIGTLISICSAGALIWWRASIEALLASYTIAGWLLFIFGATTLFTIAKATEALYKRWTARTPAHHYLKHGQFKWEVSSHFINGGFRTSVESCSRSLIREYVKGPLCPNCMAEFFTLKPGPVPGGDQVAELLNECRICGFRPSTRPAGSADDLAADAYRFMQAELRKDASKSALLTLKTPEAKPANPPSAPEPRISPADSTVFFHERMCDAFPGQRGIITIENASDAIARLRILLKGPLEFSGYSPIWCLPETGSFEIDRFEHLGDQKVLISAHEAVVTRLHAFRSEIYWQDLVFVECAADQPTGLYKTSGSYEEYATWNGRNLTREQYDDGAILIGGASINIKGAELRVRRLKPHGYFILAQRSPVHSLGFDSPRRELVPKLVDGSLRFDAFTRIAASLPKHPRED